MEIFAPSGGSEVWLMSLSSIKRIEVVSVPGLRFFPAPVGVQDARTQGQQPYTVFKRKRHVKPQTLSYQRVGARRVRVNVERSTKLRTPTRGRPEYCCVQPLPLPFVVSLSSLRSLHTSYSLLAEKGPWMMILVGNSPTEWGADVMQFSAISFKGPNMDAKHSQTRSPKASATAPLAFSPPTRVRISLCRFSLREGWARSSPPKEASATILPFWRPRESTPSRAVFLCR